MDTHPLKEVKLYKKNGKLMSLVHKDNNGVYQGQHEWYNENDQVCIKGIMENGRPIGLWLILDVHRYYL